MYSTKMYFRLSDHQYVNGLFGYSGCSVNFCTTVLPESKLQRILENKGGLDVTDYGQFGELMMGERQELVLWIQ